LLHVGGAGKDVGFRFLTLLLSYSQLQGFLNEAFARINATLTTEIATGLGYEIEMFPLAGAAYVASVRVPASRMDCYWIGANNRWYYVWSRELPNAN
jgi:hypothetical protein